MTGEIPCDICGDPKCPRPRDGSEPVGNRRWQRVTGGAVSTVIILVGLGMADSINHYLLAAIMNALIGLVFVVAYDPQPAAEFGSSGGPDV